MFLSQSYDQLEIIVVNDGSIGDDYLNHKYSDQVKQINLKVNQKRFMDMAQEALEILELKAHMVNGLLFWMMMTYGLDNKIENKSALYLYLVMRFCSTDALIGNGRYDKNAQLSKLFK